MDIKTRLLNARNKKGLTIRKAGELADITPSNIHRYEGGLMPSIQTLEKLAEIYDTTPIYLANWDKYVSTDEEFLLAKKIKSLSKNEQKVIEDVIDLMIAKK